MRGEICCRLRRINRALQRTCVHRFPRCVAVHRGKRLRHRHAVVRKRDVIRAATKHVLSARGRLSMAEQM